MSEINRENFNINSRKDISFNGQKKSETTITNEVSVNEQIPNNDLKTHSEVIGRSQVKPFDPSVLKTTLADRIRKDLETMQKNPELVAKSDIMFEKALEAGIGANDKNAYQKAVAMQAQLVEELKD